MRNLFIILWISLCAGSVMAQTSPVRTGGDLLVESNFEPLAGTTIGLIVNHTALVGDEHLINLVDDAPNVTLGAIFGPEHGLRGTAEDGEAVKDGIDQRTGAPVYSLYGQTRRPTLEMLDGIDLLVYDIQDVGSRFYTYISTMGLAMQSAAEANIPFMVLDRPNPLSGTYVSGFLLESPLQSFVGQYSIPITHGLTVGELAQMIQAEALLPGLDSLDVRVMRMQGWTRDMQWPDTGRPWVPTSPNIPRFETALVYPGTCLFESTSGSEGRGTLNPFLQVGTAGVNGGDIAEMLNQKLLPGVLFEGLEFTPAPIGSMESAPKLDGQAIQGLAIKIIDRQIYQPVETGIHILHAYYHSVENMDAFLTRPEWLAKLSGTSALEDMLKTKTPEEIIASWQPDIKQFIQKSETYYLYE